MCSDLNGLHDCQPSCQKRPSDMKRAEGLHDSDNDFCEFGEQAVRQERCLRSRDDEENPLDEDIDFAGPPCGSFAPAELLEDIYELKRPSFQDVPGTCLAVHRATGATRRLVQVVKPTGAEEQQRLRTFVQTLQGVQSDSIVRVLEVFEDWRATSLITEHCAGGSIYDRILKLPRLCTPSPYFAEQESAVIIRHALQSLHALHRAGLSHGHPTPESFHFESAKTHATMKLIDFGLEFKAHAWDSLHAMGCRGPFDRGRAACLQFYEPCRIVFCAPEVVRPPRTGNGPTSFPAAAQGCAATTLAGVADAAADDDGQLDLLSEVINSHIDSMGDLDARHLEPADSWSVGAMAFILLCGYPPFFAPCRYAILARIESTEYAFDPPFWSKVSEEAKDFVQRCLRAEPSERMSVAEALSHPWIQCLADTSPPGPMLPSFALNLRRFVRTALIEKTTGNALACSLSFAQLQEFATECRRTDASAVGFFTATDLKQALVRLGHSEVAEHIAVCFSRALRHPGESYIDYVTLAQSVRARQERLLEEDLWRSFLEFTEAANAVGGATSEETETSASTGHISLLHLSSFLQIPEVCGIMWDHGVEDISAFAESVDHAVRSVECAPAEEVTAPSELRVDFLEVSAEVIRHLPSIEFAGPGGCSQPRALVREDSISSSSFRSPPRSPALPPSRQSGAGAPAATQFEIDPAGAVDAARASESGGCSAQREGSRRVRPHTTTATPSRPRAANSGTALRAMRMEEAPPSPPTAMQRGVTSAPDGQADIGRPAPRSSSLRHPAKPRSRIL